MAVKLMNKQIPSARSKLKNNIDAGSRCQMFDRRLSSLTRRPAGART